MIKRIKGSLFAKVFILTVAVLLCVSFLVYGVLAWYMPQTYSNNLNAALDEQASDFIYELEHIRMQDILLYGVHHINRRNELQRFRCKVLADAAVLLACTASELDRAVLHMVGKALFFM